MSNRDFVKAFRNQQFCCDNRKIFSQLPDDCVDLILTDPPYKSYQSNRPLAHAKVKLVDGALFDAAYFAQASYRVLKPGGHLYCFCDHLTFSDIRAELERAGFQYKNCLVWVKNNHGSGDLRGNWAPQHEFVIFVSKGRGQSLNGKRKSNVLLKRQSDGSLQFYQKVSNYRYNHGTSKPVDILRVIVQASSSPGDLIFDPYGGSGSTAEACVLEERHYLMTEIDPDHFTESKERLDELERIERIQYNLNQQVTP
jgi:site-specific DNA-methyltransferase (adenine-specific)